PDETSTTVASGGTITLSQSMVLQARAYKAGLAPSSVTRGLYKITGAVASGWSHVVALKADGTSWSWGANGSHQLGDPNFTGSRRATPAQVPGLTDVVAIAAGRL